MPKHRNTPYDRCLAAAKHTVDLVDHQETPDRVSDAVLHTLIEMSGEWRIQIWDNETGIHLEKLATLYTLYPRGAGHRRARIYGRYEAERLYRERKERPRT
jgi:hypothetical protein